MVTVAVSVYWEEAAVCAVVSVVEVEAMREIVVSGETLGVKNRGLSGVNRAVRRCGPYGIPLRKEAVPAALRTWELPGIGTPLS